MCRNTYLNYTWLSRGGSVIIATRASAFLSFFDGRSYEITALPSFLFYFLLTHAHFFLHFCAFGNGTTQQTSVLSITIAGPYIILFFVIFLPRYVTSG